MKFAYSLNQDDYLNLKLFLASKSDMIKKERIRKQITTPIVFLCIACIFFLTKESFLTYYFLIVAVLLFFYYRYSSSGYYKREYKKIVNETYKYTIGKVTNITIDDEQIQNKSESIETTIPISGVESIYEIPNYFYLKLKSARTLIIPKQKIENVPLLKDKLKTIAEKQQVIYTELQGWEWK